MSITAAMVKDLREKTAAGMMDCKKALTECDGDMEKAVDWLRQKGLSKAAKKAGRATSEGLVGFELAADGKSGDGCGLLMRKPDAFLRQVAAEAGIHLGEQPGRAGDKQPKVPIHSWGILLVFSAIALSRCRHPSGQHDAHGGRRAPAASLR